MQDPEFVELKNKFLLGILVSIIFLIPFFFFFYNHSIGKKEEVVQRINHKESFFILITENACKKCKSYKRLLKENHTDFLIINKDKDFSYQELLKKIQMEEKDIIIPTIIYIDKGELISSIADIKEEEELEIFLINYGVK